MKIAIVSRHDPMKIDAWSGTAYFVAREIMKISDEVVIIRPDKNRLILKLAKILGGLITRVTSKDIDLSRTDIFSRSVGKEIQKKIELIKPQVVVGIAASPELANITSTVPIFHISDATYAVMTGYYPAFSNIPNWLWRQGNEIERKIIRKAFCSILPSQWAVNSALVDYGIKSDKVRLIKLGANVSELPKIDEEYLAKKFDNKCRILFVGKDWERKGGDILLSTFNTLKKLGFDSELTIVGCKPFKGNPPEDVTVYESISKYDPEGFRLYNKLHTEASFFMLPTQAEAFGNVFAEAAAFATPVLASQTGGVPSVIDNGKTGLLLPLDASGEDYADVIISLWSDKKKLREMGKSAHEKFLSELNWDKWREEFSALLKTLV